jgi:hypothetical protein
VCERDFLDASGRAPGESAVCGGCLALDGVLGAIVEREAALDAQDDPFVALLASIVEVEP